MSYANEWEISHTTRWEISHANEWKFSHQNEWEISNTNEWEISHTNNEEYHRQPGEKYLMQISRKNHNLFNPQFVLVNYYHELSKRFLKKVVLPVNIDRYSFVLWISLGDFVINQPKLQLIATQVDVRHSIHCQPTPHNNTPPNPITKLKVLSY